jgi:hypothetical protein
MNYYLLFIVINKHKARITIYIVTVIGGGWERKLRRVCSLKILFFICYFCNFTKSNNFAHKLLLLNFNKDNLK